VLLEALAPEARTFVQCAPQTESRFIAKHSTFNAGSFCGVAVAALCYPLNEAPPGDDDRERQVRLRATVGLCWREARSASYVVELRRKHRS
jgi:hypothetical protein